MKNKKGFTLVELLAVIVLILLISALALTNITKKSNEMKEMSNYQFEKALTSSAKMYVSKNNNIKNELKTGATVKVEYTTLQDKGYLPDKIKSVKTYNEINVEDYCVCVKYLNYEYSYEVKKIADCN